VYTPKTGATMFFIGTIGISIINGLIVIFIISGIMLTILSLAKNRIALEPARHSDGTHWLAITKNGIPIKWISKKRNK